VTEQEQGREHARWSGPRGLPEVWRRQIAGATLRDAGHGCDPLGASREGLARGVMAARFFYERYFRVRSQGHAHLPATGPAILASNHGGMLPFDAMMIALDVLRHSSPPRFVRPILDHFVPALPVVNTFFTRAGAIGGSRGNVRYALESGEMLLIFPEGTRGIGKLFWERYRLQEWRVGHVELAIRYGAPIVPVAVIGAEEQWPQIARLPAPRALGFPYVPIPALPLPLPVRYHIYYGEPIAVQRRFQPSEADDLEVVEAAAAEVKEAVAGLVARGLAEREGIFG
jgi:1-acyl-sn-glycerol-3-phosphate acyltransferase